MLCVAKGCHVVVGVVPSGVDQELLRRLGHSLLTWLNRYDQDWRVHLKVAAVYGQCFMRSLEGSAAFMDRVSPFSFFCDCLT